MRYSAFVVPAVGTALVKGEIHSCVATAVRLLDTNPGYTVAIRRGEGAPLHSITIRKTAAGYVVTDQPGATLAVDQAAMAADLDDVHTVLSNLGCTPITNQETP